MRKKNSVVVCVHSLCTVAVALVFMVAVVIGEQIIWNISVVTEPPITIENRETFGLGPGDFGQYLLSRLQLDANTNKDIGRPGVINDVSVVFAGPKIPFENFADARLNLDTGFFEIDGFARLNILEPFGNTPSQNVNPFDGSRCLLYTSDAADE